MSIEADKNMNGNMNLFNDALWHVNDEIKTTLQQLYAHQDGSHGWDHAQEVARLARQIFTREARGQYEDEEWRYYINVRDRFRTIDKYELTARDIQMLIYGALCHDIMDHKYEIERKKCMSDEHISGELRRVITVDGGADEEAIEFIWWVMANNSWSKERRGLTRWHGRWHMMQAIIQDADRLLAIGKIGIERCLQFHALDGNARPEFVIRHMFEKLLIVPRWMRFGATIEIITENRDMDVMIDYVEQWGTPDDIARAHDLLIGWNE